MAAGSVLGPPGLEQMWPGEREPALPHAQGPTKEGGGLYLEKCLETGAVLNSWGWCLRAPRPLRPR